MFRETSAWSCSLGDILLAQICALSSLSKEKEEITTKGLKRVIASTLVGHHQPIETIQRLVITLHKEPREVDLKKEVLDKEIGTIVRTFVEIYGLDCLKRVSFSLSDTPTGRR